jgi:hypothetical protein
MRTSKKEIAVQAGVAHALTVANTTYADALNVVKNAAVKAETSAPPAAYFSNFHKAINRAINPAPLEDWDDVDRAIKTIIAAREAKRVLQDYARATAAGADKPYKIPYQRMLGRINIEVAMLRALAPAALHSTAQREVLALEDRSHD